MMEIVTRRDRREGFLADHMTMYSLNYIFSESFELSGTFIKMVLGDNKVDIDKIYDWCELNHKSLEQTLRKVSLDLYNKSNPYQKTIYFYKFIHNLGLEIMDLVDTVYKLLSDEIMHGNSELNYDNIIGIFLDKLDTYASLEVSIRCNHQLKIIDLFGMNSKDHIDRLSGHCHDTFNNVIKNEYRVRLQEGWDALNSLRSGNIHTPEIWPEVTGTGQFNCITQINGPQIPTYSSNTSRNLACTYRNLSTGTPLFYNGARMGNSSFEAHLGELTTGLSRITGNNGYPIKKNPLNKNTPGVKRLNKSLKVFRKYIPAPLTTNFLRCLEINIPGLAFNWALKLKSRTDLVRYSEYLTNTSIAYDLYIMTKNNIKITRCCIVFNGCPILDEVLAIYMMIKTGKELEIINGSGFFDKDKTLFENFITPLLDKKSTPTNAMEDLHLACNNNLDGSGIRSILPEHYRQPAEIKSRIKSWLMRHLNIYIPENIIEYNTNLDVSWGEAVDYEAFHLFDIDDFNHYVRPLVWSINKP